MEIEGGNSRSHSVENSLWKRLWTCRKSNGEWVSWLVNAVSEKFASSLFKADVTADRGSLLRGVITHDTIVCCHIVLPFAKVLQLIFSCYFFRLRLLPKMHSVSFALPMSLHLISVYCLLKSTGWGSPSWHFFPLLFYNFLFRFKGLSQNSCLYNFTSMSY